MNSSGFESGIQQAQGAFSGLGSTISAGSIAAGQVLGNLVTSAAGAVKDFAGAAIETGKAYEAGISQIAATLGYSLDELADPTSEAAQNMAALSAKAEEMGRTTSFTAADAAEGLNILAMAGFDASTAIEMIPTVLNLAKAGSMGLGEAASYVAGSMKGFTGEAGDFADALEASATYADIMAAGATKANTSVSELGAAMSGSSAIASSYGQSSTEVGVALLRLAEQSVTGSAAATALSAVMKDLYAGTDQAKDALEALGVSAYDSSGEARDLNDVVGDLDAALSQLTTQERADLENVIFGIQGKSAFDKMVATTGEKLESFYDAIETSSGSAAQQAETMAANVQGAGDTLQSALEGFEIAIFKHLSEPLQQAQTIGADALNALTEGLEAGGVRGAFEALGTVIEDVFGKAQDMLSGLFDGIEVPEGLSGIGDIFRDLASAAEPLKTAFTDTLSSAISEVGGALSRFVQSFQDSGAVGGIISSIASGAGDLLSAFGTVAGDVIEIAAGAISMFLDALSESGAVSSIIGTIAEGAGRLISAFSGAAVDVMEGVSAAVGSFMDAFDNGVLTDIISKVADGANHLISSIQKGRADTISAIGSGIKNFLNAFSESSIPGIIADIATNAAAFFDTIATVTGDLIAGIGSGIKTFIAGFDNKGAVSLIGEVAQWVGDLFGFFTGSISGIITSIADAFSGFGDKVAELWNTAGPSLSETGEAFHAFADNVRDAIERFKAVVQPVAEWIASVLAVGIQIAVENIVRVFGNLWNAAMNVITFLQDGFGAFVDLMHGDVEGAVEGFKSAWENIKEFFENIKEHILAPFRTLASVLGDEGNKGVAAIKKPFEMAWEWFVGIGSNLIEGLKSGISSAWSGLTSWFDEKISGLVDGVMGLLGIHSPSTIFAGIGENMVLGLRKGWGEEFGGLESQVYRDVRRLTDTARIGFEDSAIGKSSAAEISSMALTNSIYRGGQPVKINLVLDGDVAASALYDPLQRTAFQKGHGSTGGVLQPA